MMNQSSPSTSECCPVFDPTPWDLTIHKWDHKHFIIGKVFTFFYMPLNFGSVMTKLMNHLEKNYATSPDNLCLSDHTSMWNMNIYLATDREIPDVGNQTISGTFFSKVYEGEFKDTGKWCADFEKELKSRDKKLKKMYMWYTTCPKCAKKYGKNYVVIFGEIISQ